MQFWSLHYWEDAQASERFTRMLLAIEGISSKESLDKLGLFSLESGRLRGDLIEVFKVMRGVDIADVGIVGRNVVFIMLMGSTPYCRNQTVFL